MSFKNLSPERLHEIARKGGISAHKQGKAHRFTHEEAVEAGRKGALAKAKKKEKSNETP